MSRINEQLVMGLDIGASTITCIIGEVGPSGRVTIWGAGDAPSLGMRKGRVADLDLAATSLYETVKSVRSSVGSEIVSVKAGFSPHFIDTYSKKVVVPITGSGHRVTKRDIHYAFRMLKEQQVDNKKIVHIIPTEFYIDSQLVKEPLDRVGNNLAINALVITTSSENISEINKILKEVGINVNEVLLSYFVSAEALLNATEKEFGAIHIDFGGQTTGIAVYNGGILKNLVVLPVGSDYITSDLAVGIRTPLSCAEQIKIRYGVTPDISTGGIIEVNKLREAEKKQVSCRLVADIIEARVSEIFTMVNDSIERINYNGLVPSGVIISGGGALLPGLRKLAEKHLELPVRIHMPEVQLKPGVRIDNISYWGAWGLIKYQSQIYGGKFPQREKDVNTSVNSAGGLVGRFKTWLNEHL